MNKDRTGRLGVGLKHKLDARIFGAKLGAKIHDTKFGTKIHGAKLAAISASTPPTWPRPRRQTLWRRDV